MQEVKAIVRESRLEDVIQALHTKVFVSPVTLALDIRRNVQGVGSV